MNVHMVPIMAIFSGTCLQYGGGIDPWQVPQGINRTSLFVTLVSPEAAGVPPLDVNY